MSKQRGRVILTAGLILLLTFALLPIYWAVITSVKPTPEIEKGKLYPSAFTMEHYKRILHHNPAWGAFLGTNLLIPLRNSLVVAVSVALLAIIVGALAGYGLAMIPLRGKGFISGYVLFAYVFPPFIIIVPLSILLNRLGLLNRLLGVGLAHLIISVPFATWMLRGYFMGIPKELEEAALVDGCSRVGALFRVILPISAPGLVTAAIFSFTQSWSELLFGLIILNSKELFTLPIAATMMAFGEIYRWGELMATAVLAATPPVILYMLIQRYVVRGLMAGAVKS